MQHAKTSGKAQRLAALGLGVASLALAFGFAARAEDTGSLQQYFLTLVLAVFGISRLVRAVRRKAAA